MTPDEFIAKFRIRSFFHFTDSRNVDSIRANGAIYSSRKLADRGIAPVAPGGNSWSRDADKLSGMDAYVHLCLIAEHPMEYRARENGQILESRFLSIGPEVLSIQGVCFTPGVSNKSGVTSLTLAEAVKTMDFSALFDRLDWKDAQVKARRQEARKYELLVPDMIPLELVKGL